MLFDAGALIKLRNNIQLPPHFPMLLANQPSETSANYQRCFSTLYHGDLHLAAGV